MEEKIIDTNENKEHGTNRCPNCGANNKILKGESTEVKIEE